MRKVIGGLLIAAGLVGGGQVQAQWRGQDIQRQVAITVLLAADWAQTRQIARNPQRWEELNPLLGSHPSEVRVRNYFLAVAAASAMLTVALPEEWRESAQLGQVKLEGLTVLRNRQIGLRFSF